MDLRGYAFGDSDIAVRRLQIVAEVFGESSRRFLSQAALDKPRLAVDLGCGLGYTTHLLADTLKCDKVIGFDNSERFISLAKRTETGRVSSHLHDVTSFPFPVPPSDLLYCRFLLMFLQDPQSLVIKWANQLRSGGLIMIEEVEDIATQTPLFSTYLKIVGTMLEAQSNNLYVGRILKDLKDTDFLQRRSSQISSVKVSHRQAATMFYMNIQSWKHGPFIQENYPPATIKQIEENLGALARESRETPEVEWRLRQMVLERV